MNYDAVFSECRLYRYSWKCTWDMDLPPLVVIGLNPSTADEQRKDPTVTRCMNFGKSWGYGALWMVNLFAFRATDPRAMKSAMAPIGSDNDDTLRTICVAAHAAGGMNLAAWGNHGAHLKRSIDVVRLLSDVPLRVLKFTKSGQPQHPLYLASTLTPFEFVGGYRRVSE